MTPGAPTAPQLAARARMWRQKALYFLLFGGMACAWPWLPLLSEKRYGLGSAAVSRLAAARTLTGALVAPLWGAAADATGWHPRLHALSLTTSALVRLALALAPRACGEATLLALVIASEALGAAATCLADGSTNAALERAGMPLGAYGRQRLWGAIGWGWVFAPLSGAIIADLGEETRWVATFGLHVGVIFVTAALALTLDHTTPAARRSAMLKRKRSDDELAAFGGARGAPAAPSSSARRMARVLRHPRVALTYAAFFLAASFMGMVETYLFLYLDMLGGTTLLMGLALTFTCLSEVAIFFYAERIMDALGNDRSITFVFVCFAARFGLYGVLPVLGSPWIVLPVQLLHGITFGLFYAVGQRFTHTAAPAGLEATCQGLLNGCVSGGMFTGALLLGWPFAWDPQRTWLVLAGIALCAAPLFYAAASSLMPLGDRRGTVLAARGGDVRGGGGRTKGPVFFGGDEEEEEEEAAGLLLMAEDLDIDETGL